MASTLEIYDELTAQGFSMREIADKVGIGYNSLRDAVRRRERNAERRGTDESTVVWVAQPRAAMS